MLLLVAVDPDTFVDDFFFAIATAVACCALSVGQIVAPFAFVFGPVKHALDVLRVVFAEHDHRTAPDALA